jgi:hypothetical protein
MPDAGACRKRQIEIMPRPFGDSARRDFGAQEIPYRFRTFSGVPTRSRLALGHADSGLIPPGSASQRRRLSLFGMPRERISTPENFSPAAVRMELSLP